MSNNYYRILNTSLHLFNKEQIEEDYTALVTTTKNNSAGLQICLDKNTDRAFTKTAYEWIESHGCKISTGRIFYTRPGGILGWHDDGEQGDYAKFNFVWGSDNHQMLFAEPKSNISYNSLTVKNRVGTYYREYNLQDLQNIISIKVDRPILMNGNVPHEVRNFSPTGIGPTGRWCLNMILTYKGSRLFWNDALEIFSEHLI
jgi:hypothetical protein